MHPIDSYHNTTFFLKLTWSNISLWCYFWIDFCLNIFRNMLSSAFQHSVRQRALWETDQCWNHMFQRSQILDELIPPAHTESFVTFSSRSALARNSVVNLLYCLADHLFRGFHFMDDQFQARRLKWLKLFSLCFPASGARSRSVSNPAFYTVFSPLLDFSGSSGFGTWRIFVPLFLATCRPFSSFLLLWILECFCLWILYTLFTLVLLRYQGGVF
jgi:hypothetical protein